MKIVQFPDPQMHPPWRSLVEQFADVERNTLITHSELTAAMEMKSLSEMDQKSLRKYYAEVGKFRLFMLKNKNVHFETIPTQGYRAVLPKEHVRHALDKAQHGNRRFADAARIVTHVDLDQLSTKEVSEVALVQTTLGAFRADAQRKLREFQKMIAAKKEETPTALPGAVM